MNVKKQLTALSFLIAVVVTPSSPYATTPKDYTVPIITCSPRPACLDSKPPCKIAEPIAGWCTPILKNPTCYPRPACLDSNPPCRIIIPNICPPTTPTPTLTNSSMSCGGNNKAVVCPTGYTCLYGKDTKKGGTCIPFPSPSHILLNKTEQQKVIFTGVWGFIVSFFKH